MSGLGYGKIDLIKKIVETNYGADPEKAKYQWNDVLFIIQEMLDDQGKKYLERDHKQAGKEKYKVFKEFVAQLVYRNMANYDTMLLLEGDKGTGKSSAAIMLARMWCKLLDIEFDPDRHIAYSNADLMNKIDNLKKYEPIIADEAANFASSSDWAKTENKELRKKLAQIRTKHLFFILCFPMKVYKLEKTYLESFVNYWVSLYGRGLGGVFIKDKNPVNDSWRLHAFTKLGSFNDFTKKSDVIKKLKKHPNFWKPIVIPKVPKKVYNKYLVVRERNVYNQHDVNREVSKQDLVKSLLINALNDIMTNDKTFTMKRIIQHIKAEYSIPVSKNDVGNIVDDAKQLVSFAQQNVEDQEL